MKMTIYNILDKFHKLLLIDTGKYSDLHITSGEECFYRKDGILQKSAGCSFDENEVKELINILLVDKVKKEKLLKNAVDIAYVFSKRRLRISIYRQQDKYALAIRFINNMIPNIEDDIYPTILRKLAVKNNGLILLTGATGSGKSTTLATMVNYRAKYAPCHIITLEDPIEYIFSSTKSLIHQRELGSDFSSFEEALKSALRQDPDLILVGEIRDKNTMRAALNAAQTGHLVLSTLHTSSAAQSLIRIESMFTEDAVFIRTELSMVLQAIISQKLLQKKGGGRVGAMEILMATDAVRALILAGRPQQIDSALQTGKEEGMQTMSMAIERLRQRGIINSMEY